MKLVMENARVSNRPQRTYGRDTHHQLPTNDLTGSVLKTAKKYVCHVMLCLSLHLREVTELGLVKGAFKERMTPYDRVAPRKMGSVP